MGERIRQAREASGHSIAARFCRLTEISVSTLWRYEHGEIAPGADALARIAAACGVTIDWIVTGDGQGPKGRAA